MNRPAIACSVWLLLAPACAATSRAPASEAPPRAQPQPPPAPAPGAVQGRPVSHGPVFDRTSMQLDLDMWLAEMEAAHPDPYTRISREAFHARVREARARLPDNLDPVEYFAVLQGLASALRDGHTQFQLPEQSAAYSDDWFPLSLRVQDGRVFVDRARADIARGCEITRINGMPAARILDTARGLVSAEIASGDELAASMFVPVLWLAGVRAPFRIEGLSDARQPIDLVLDARIPPSDPPERPPYRLDWLEGGVAYLAIHDMTDANGFAAFAQDAFEAIAQKRAKGLVVDLRENIGGDTEVGALLLDRITKKPHRMIAEKHWHVSARQQAQMIESGYAARDYVAAPIGTTLHYRDGPMRSPRVVAPTFRGPVCVLIGSHTESSAMMLANAIEDYHLATLIGEPTASPPNYFGEVLAFHLRRTRLEADVSTARFVRANGDATNTNPVMPDIVVHQSVDEWLRDEDAVLRRALAWIATGR